MIDKLIADDKLSVDDKRFVKAFEQKFQKTIDEYKLCTKKDKILVGCSGGKDSTTVLYLLNKFGYHAEAFIIDLHIGSWSNRNLENVKRLCKDYNFKINIVDLREALGSSMCFIRSGIQEKVNLKNCTICGVMKRWILNQYSKKLKATKLATGHNTDDEAETVMMNFFKGNLKLSMGLGPKSGVSTQKGFVQRIKPLYFFLNTEVTRYSRLMNFPVLYEPCPCSTESFRRQVRNNLTELEKKNPDIKRNIVKNFIKYLPALRNSYATENAIKQCSYCGEPSRSSVCRACSLLAIIRNGK